MNPFTQAECALSDGTPLILLFRCRHPRIDAARQIHNVVAERTTMLDVACERRARGTLIHRDVRAGFLHPTPSHYSRATTKRG